VLGRASATSRAGIRRGSLSLSWRGWPGPLPTAVVAGFARRCWVLMVARALPGSLPRAIACMRSDIEAGSLPEERGEFAGDGDRHQTGGPDALEVEVLAEFVEAPMRSPGDVDDPASWPTRQRGRVVVIGGVWR